MDLASRLQWHMSLINFGKTSNTIMDKTKIFLKIVGISFILYLAICWIHMFPIELFALARPLCFGGLTFYFLERYYNQGALGICQVMIAVFIGSVLPEIPVRILDWNGTLFTIPVTAYTFGGIILGGWCFKEKKASVVVASMFIMLLLCTFLLREWTTWYHGTH